MVPRRQQAQAANTSRNRMAIPMSIIADSVNRPSQTYMDSMANEQPVSARVMTYNIGRGKDGSDGAEQDELDEVAATIAEQGPDVVSLQEVHKDDIPILLDILKDEHGLEYHADFAGALPDGNTSSDYDPTRTSPYGIAVLSRNPIVNSSHRDLPNPGGHENRVLQQVTTTVDGQQVTVFNTHLTQSKNEQAQQEQTELLLELAAENPGPTIVTGDFNQTPGTLADRAKDVGVNGRVDVANDKSEPTIGLGDLNPFNNETIDYVLVSDDIQVDDHEVVDGGVSDHEAVVVDITV